MLEPVDVVGALEAAGLRVTTMGRGPEDDPLFFEAVGAATAHAARLLGSGDTVWAE